MVLRNFSLYKRRRTVEVTFNREVFCLAGANGLGKSTFLSALSYAITGTVPRPDLAFLGASQYYDDTLKYSARYFEGRIQAADHDLAEVELEMTVGRHHFSLVRGMFAPQGLRELRVRLPDGTTVDYSAGSLTESERHSRYVEAIQEATGLESFAQLVFLQLFVLTFDEERRLLFWSDRVAEQALFLAFGVSPEKATQAEALQRTYDSAESKARNLQWQATGVRRRLRALQEALGSDDSPDSERDIESEHIGLTNALTAAGNEHARLLSAVSAAEAAVDEAVSDLVRAQAAYEAAYVERLGRSRRAQNSPVIVRALEDGVCLICGTEGSGITDRVTASLESRRCPLCESDLVEPDDAEETKRQTLIAKLGEAVVECETGRRHATDHLARQQAELNAVDRKLRHIDHELTAFRAANTQALLRQESDGSTSVVEDAQRGMQREIADLLTQKDEQLERRDRAQADLNVLRHELTERFAEMEDEFVPLLQDLAHEFLGVPLQVDLEQRGAQLGLQLAFDGSQRAAPDTLSESQRYFMDIALRMALAQKLAQPHETTTLYIDTPEGSLDIAYESRAGRMFGKFASAGNRVVMTANINTSQLLLELASSCGQERMELVRMTDWTELTDVQQEAEGLFDQAYGAIEQRLLGEEK
jgi:energy-coupling factor transporter ATP-binding protein EcfA2